MQNLWPCYSLRECHNIVSCVKKGPIITLVDTDQPKQAYVSGLRGGVRLPGKCLTDRP